MLLHFISHREQYLTIWTVLTYLTPLSRVLGKLTVSQFIKEFPAFRAFTSARHLYLSWARSIQLLTVHNYQYLNYTSHMGDNRNAKKFWCEHMYTEENHNNVMYQARLWHLKQHTYRISQTAHLQDISNSTPTRDLIQHTYKWSQEAHMQETSRSTPTGCLKQYTHRRPQTAHIQKISNSTPTGDQPAVAHVASTTLICKNL